MTSAESGIEGTVVRRGDPDYERYRTTGWNARVAKRYPDSIVVAASRADVLAVVRQARRDSVRIAVRTGGHHWQGSALRDGGILLDVSRLADLEIEPRRRVARVGPGVRGIDLARALAAYHLAFPVGHCADVPMGGYLLQGGLGLNWNRWKPACFSVIEIEVVTAEGEVVVANDDHEPDLMWLARGSGPGFPGVVTRFDLELHSLPRAATSSSLAFPIEMAPEVLPWVREAAARMPDAVELSTFLAGRELAGMGPMLGLSAPSVIVTASAFVDTSAEAEAALAPLRSCPLADRATGVVLDLETPFQTLPELTGSTLPRGYRVAADAQWSARSTRTIAGALVDHVARAPSPASCVNTLMLPSAGSGYPRPGAYTMDRRTLTIVYGFWQDPADDESNQNWVRHAMNLIEPYAVGRYLGESDPLVAHRVRDAFEPPAWERIQRLRQRYDPENMFHGYLAEG